MKTLRAFHLAATLGSLTKAAEVLDSTQSTISRQIGALERELDTNLIVHGQRPLELTQAGEALVRLAKVFLQGVDLLDTPGPIAEEESSITIVATPSMGSLFLPRVVGEFRLTYTKCRVHLVGGTRVEALSMIQAGFVDLGVLPDPEMSTQFSFEPLFETPIALFTPIDHPLAQTADMTLQAIAEHPLILLKKGTSTRMIVDAGLRHAGLPSAPVIEAESFETVRNLVAMGYGIAIGPSAANQANVKSLNVRDLSEYFPPLRTGVVSLKGQGMSPVALAFTESLRSYRWR